VKIPGVELKPAHAVADERGRFAEIYRASDDLPPFVQANHSRSRAHVLRGLHYHRKQADLWYVIRGTARVGLVDLRAREVDPPVSETVDLSEEEPATLFVPPGVAHGFAALTDVELVYWVTAEYDASDEYGIAWDDPAIGLDWGVRDPILSDRDTSNPRLAWNDIPPFS
jgi:dTDP-4-dehydrorhamnose 3,5-epimerase